MVTISQERRGHSRNFAEISPFDYMACVDIDGSAAEHVPASPASRNRQPLSALVWRNRTQVHGQVLLTKENIPIMESVGSQVDSCRTKGSKSGMRMYMESIRKVAQAVVARTASPRSAGRRTRSPMRKNTTKKAVEEEIHFEYDDLNVAAETGDGPVSGDATPRNDTNDIVEPDAKNTRLASRCQTMADMESSIMNESPWLSSSPFHKTFPSLKIRGFAGGRRRKSFPAGRVPESRGPSSIDATFQDEVTSPNNLKTPKRANKLKRMLQKIDKSEELDNEDTAAERSKRSIQFQPADRCCSREPVQFATTQSASMSQLPTHSLKIISNTEGHAIETSLPLDDTVHLSPPKRKESFVKALVQDAYSSVREKHHKKEKLKALKSRTEVVACSNAPLEHTPVESCAKEAMEPIPQQSGKNPSRTGENQRYVCLVDTRWPVVHMLLCHMTND